LAVWKLFFSGWLVWLQKNRFREVFLYEAAFLSYPILSILFVFLSFVVHNNAQSDVVHSDVGIKPKIIVQGKIIEEHKVNFRARCFSVLDGKTLPCSFQTTMDKAHTENCSGAPLLACGHNDTHHTVSRADILKNNDAETFRILGGLTDSGQTQMTTKLPERKPPAEYIFTYHSGEIAGKITLKTEFKVPPGSDWRFAKPCEKENVCTHFQDVNVEHCGGNYFCERFVELPEPLPPNEYYIYWWDGYVRCGMLAKCQDVPDNINLENWLAYDRPYNWPAHPTVHWGKWDFNFELRMLARKWYQTFKKPLVINDISLPKGGCWIVKSLQNQIGKHHILPTAKALKLIF
jgi:hypothetical protein